MIPSNVLSDLKNFNWQIIIDYGNSLKDLNHGEWRFAKGVSIELCLEKHSNNILTRKGGVNASDFDMTSHNAVVECKSQFSTSVFCKNGKLRKSYNIKLSNTNGSVPSLSSITCDYIIVIRNDGAFAIEKDTIIKHHSVKKDGILLTIPSSDIELLTGQLTTVTHYPIGLGAAISQVILNAIP